MIVAASIIVFCILATYMATIYLRRATRSNEVASRLWDDFYIKVERILDGDFPGEVKRFTYCVAMTAGCGCLVRGYLVDHYIPNLAKIIRHPSSQTKAQSDALSGSMRALTRRQRQEVIKALVAALMFDSFANPLQGWLLRKTVKQFAASPSQRAKLPAEEIGEVQRVAVRVAVRKDRGEQEVLCAA